VPEPPTAAFPSQLAEPATSLPPSAAKATPKATSTTGGGSTGGTPSTQATGNTSTKPGTTRFTQRASGSDTAGDQGSQGPAYSDLRRLVIESDGTRARVTVIMGATVPNPMASGEEMAVGVDLFRSSTQPESDYQLYASGNEEGWIAFLDTPKGFVRYPGTFQIGGARLVFTVPWASLGGMRTGYASTFMDWDKDGVVVNQVGGDHMPNSGRLRYR
jgi:hypothetical protein